MKVLIILGITILLLISSFYFFNHQSNKQIVKESYQIIKQDSNKIKLIFEQFNSIIKSPYNKVVVYYRNGWDSLHCTFKNSENEMFKLFPQSSFQTFFIENKADAEFTIYQNECIVFSLPFSNYDLMNSKLIYTLNPQFVLTMYKTLSTYKYPEKINSKSSICQLNCNWFVVIE